jgi:hypothetical protein
MKQEQGVAGGVSILSVGGGHITLSFDPADPAERIRAARIVKEMVRSGYALLIQIEVDGEKRFQRALDFHEDVCEYVIADLDTTTATQNTEGGDHGEEGREAEAGSQPQGEGDGSAAAPKRRGRPPGKRNVKAELARAVAVAPSAGG